MIRLLSALLVAVGGAATAQTSDWEAAERAFGTECMRETGSTTSSAYGQCVIGKVQDARRTHTPPTNEPSEAAILEATLTAKYGARCQIVAPRGTPDYGRCLLDSADRDQSRVENQRQSNEAARRALLLQMMQNQPAPAPNPLLSIKPLQVPQPRPAINCTTTYIGGTAYTTCN